MTSDMKTRFDNRYDNEKSECYLASTIIAFASVTCNNSYGMNYLFNSTSAYFLKLLFKLVVTMPNGFKIISILFSYSSTIVISNYISYLMYTLYNP